MSDRSGVAPWRGLSSVHRQFLGYLLSGGLSTAIDLIVFRGLLFLLARRAYLGLRLSEIDLSYEHFTVRSALRRALGIDSAQR